jgi:hypothetical protein
MKAMTIRTMMLIAAVIALQAEGTGQARDTTSARTSEHRQERARRGMGGFRDENGNGIDDRIENQANASASRKDRFVDEDGDGICDGRAAGLGFKRGFMGGPAGTGKANGTGNGNGNQYGRGGKK